MTLVNPYEQHIQPAIDRMVDRYGDTFGEAPVREACRSLFWINTCGSGVHPDEQERVLEQAVTACRLAGTETTFVDDPELDFPFVSEVNQSLIDSMKRHEVFVPDLVNGFRELWPEGRDTVVIHG